MPHSPTVEFPLTPEQALLYDDLGREQRKLAALNQPIVQPIDGMDNRRVRETLILMRDHCAITIAALYSEIQAIESTKGHARVR